MFNLVKPRSEIYCKGKIIVNIASDRYIYDLSYTSDNYPVYLPPMTKVGDGNNNIDEILFLPTPSEKFKNHIDSKRIHSGYTFSFYSNANTFMRLIDNPDVSYESYDVSFSVNRIKFQICNRVSIKVVGICDNLFPPQRVTIQASSTDMANKINEYVDVVLNKYCQHYITAKV